MLRFLLIVAIACIIYYYVMLMQIKSLDTMTHSVWRTVNPDTRNPMYITFPIGELSTQYIGITEDKTTFYPLTQIKQNYYGFTAVAESMNIRVTITYKSQPDDNVYILQVESLESAQKQPVMRSYNLVRHAPLINNLDKIVGTFKSMVTEQQPAGNLFITKNGKLYDVKYNSGTETIHIKDAQVVADNYSVQFIKDGRSVFTLQMINQESLSYQTPIGVISLNVTKQSLASNYKQEFLP